MSTTVIFIISYDLWFYVSHLALHHRALYKYHKEHHKYVNPTWRETNEGSAFESIFQMLGLFLPFIVYYYNNTLDTLVEFLVAAALIGARALMRHDDRCTFLIGNHHLLHHRYPSYNFGEYWLDALCGTVCPYSAEHRRGLLFFL